MVLCEKDPFKEIQKCRQSYGQPYLISKLRGAHPLSLVGIALD